MLGILTASKSSVLGITPRSIGGILSSCLILAKTTASCSNFSIVVILVC